MLRIALAITVLFCWVGAADARCVTSPRQFERTAGAWPKYRVRHGQRCWYLAGRHRRPAPITTKAPEEPERQAPEVPERQAPEVEPAPKPEPTFAARWTVVASSEPGLVYALVSSDPESEVMPDAGKTDPSHVAKPTPPTGGVGTVLMVVFWSGVVALLTVMALRPKRKKAAPGGPGAAAKTNGEAVTYTRRTSRSTGSTRRPPWPPAPTPPRRTSRRRL